MDNPFTLTLGLWGICGLLACRADPPPPQRVPQTPPALNQTTNLATIGVLLWSDTIVGQKIMRQGLEAEAARLLPKGPAFRLDIQIAGDGPQRQARQIEQMLKLIKSGVNILIVQPTDSVALGGALKAANQAHIPVVAFDQYIEGGQLSAYVTSDNYQAGALDGEYIASLYPDEYPIKLILVDYPQVSSTVERLDGFLKQLKNLGQQYTILANYQAVEPIAGAAVGQHILHDYPNPGSVDVVFTVNDGGGLAVVEALADAQRTEIRVASIDGDPQSVANIRVGRLTVVDAAQFCSALGAEAMRLAHALLQDKPVPHHQVIPTFPVTLSTLDRYPGWDGPPPAAFDKPWPSPQPRWTPQPREIPTP